MKILMTTMGLGLGGAETHIVELTKELSAQGHQVLIASNGGEYVPEIEAAGARHLQAPMHVRSPFSMLQSFFRLWKWVRQERPDVIHAHARIPAFLSHFVAKLTGTPFVTTAHWWFKTSGGLGFLTRWGQQVIAVSDDIKRYLTREYDIPNENITVTVNGIDTKRFSPATPTEGLRQELGLLDKKVILTVCRMDQNACKSAFLLLDLAKSLYLHSPDTRMVLVGGGNALDTVRERAAAINKELCCPYITVTGGRTDIDKFVRMASVFVGVSRAALEAMSCETPVVLAGNAGYLGLFEQSKLDNCILTNFTCKDFPYPSLEDVEKEIDKALALSDSDRMALGSRALIEQSYSVSRMAGDALAVYGKVARQTLRSGAKNDFLLAGYYGFENAGDEALLKTIVANLHKKKPDARICVLVKKGVSYPGIDVTCADRFGLWGVLRAMKNSKVLVFGGGNLIQDATSTASALYYLLLLKTAKNMGLRTMLYGNGVGPVSKGPNRRYAKKVLNTVDVITVREELSLALLGELGVTKPKILLTADEIFTLHPPKAAERATYLTLSLRNWHSLDKEYAPKLAALTDRLCSEYGLTARLLPLMEAQDGEVCRKVYDLLTCPKEWVEPQGYLEIMRYVGESRFVIGMRLHALVFAIVQGIPFLGISYDKKIDAFGEYAHVGGSADCHNLHPEALYAQIEAMLAEEMTWKNTLSVRTAELRALAETNADLAIELL